MEINKSIVKSIAEHLSDRPFDLEYWDGEIIKYGNGNPEFKLIIKNFPSKKELLADPSVALGEAYMKGDIDIEGDLQKFFESIIRNKDSFMNKNTVFRLASKIKAPSLMKSKKDIAHHYDIGNDFYSLWLDKTMSYSCGYFKNPTDTLYDAQMNKIHHILKKLNLKEGQHLLDIGCGWGYLIIEAAKLYKVKALGITLSEEQFKKAKERIKQEGLEDLVDVQLMDYRNLEKSNLEFDRIVSVGMAEHVGHTNLPLFFKNVDSVLKESGLFLLHNITNLVETEGNKWITTYIFPGGYLPTLREELNIAADINFRTLDVESLRLHYMKTLEEWCKNFMNHLDEERDMFDDEFLRMWHLYLATCAAAFHYWDIDIHQILFSKGINNTLPMTRKYLYED
ncbi:cyclopropane-fatty-acyl-phospholipid synthase [Clostridium perfringens]|uniref:cyclopropane-fatty-acyl-phospholipid synthase family protein n=1 Tax=Clostridium perfringens TaxID=1502 RepID=UPI001A22F952|nr:cyclopropane-fatty-acyl-phospholipid synthase family protein [Clostridium perfringens]EGT5620272.1 class I SAM-dependent methyltransferase [Clostridium perfringens]EHK2441726.1 class I SAM-dependent methyltransferase [Clostridium perfringens]MDT9334788.1 cyclopropane-fatty-acyl-phospholipid synthase [Clostridium perfringens]MDT9342549.1 cyclopropane-fatty-acyl-phospholipid synthase [Clostridium perfringens]MDT9345728.1 cyclopropane-fatty-acyl-phospholipid synthase [Clostridium perfringens]